MGEIKLTQFNELKNSLRRIEANIKCLVQEDDTFVLELCDVSGIEFTPNPLAVNTTVIESFNTQGIDPVSIALASANKTNIAITPDGRYVWVCNSDSNAVTYEKYDLVSGQLVNTITGQAGSKTLRIYGLEIDPVTGTLYALIGSSSITSTTTVYLNIVNPITGDEETFQTFSNINAPDATANTLIGPAFAADGTLYFGLADSNDIDDGTILYRLSDLSGSGTLSTFFNWTSGDVQAMTGSPDGEHFIFTLAGGGSNAYYEINPFGSVANYWGADTATLEFGITYRPATLSITSVTKFIRRYSIDLEGNIVFEDFDVNGNPYVVLGEVIPCDEVVDSPFIPGNSVLSIDEVISADFTIAANFIYGSIAVLTGTATINGAAYAAGEVLNLEPIPDGRLYGDYSITAVTGTVRLNYHY